MKKNYQKYHKIINHFTKFNGVSVLVVLKSESVSDYKYVLFFTCWCNLGVHWIIITIIINPFTTSQQCPPAIPNTTY